MVCEQLDDVFAHENQQRPEVRSQIKGPRGKKGPPGIKGEKGNVGTPGRQGLSGTPGAKGSKGTIGVPGVANETVLQIPPGKKDRLELKGNVGTTGRQGLKGPPGAKGLKGAIAAPGVADETVLQRIHQVFPTYIYQNKNGISEHYCNGFTFFPLDIADVDATEKSTENRINNLEGKCMTRRDLENCDEVYDGKCYVLITNDNRLNIDQAKGGNTANIYSKDHFYKMVALIRSRIVIRHYYHHIWTGMTLNTSTRRIYLSNGRTAAYTHWFPNRLYNPARPYVGINVESDPNSVNQGMFDDFSTGRLLGVLCEM
uniref:collagen alpha-1(I) chain-like n=1 Tax=Styela clava TaxID=7725 RepID=UPI00193989E9|nr:collagen alpha-1(I) chain-like [Styela clava]